MTDQTNVSDVIRKYMAAFLAKDRQTLEEGLADDFTFTSPRDDHINKAAFFERCLPGSDQFRAHRIEQLFTQGSEAFLRYYAELKDGSAFRNTEYVRVEGNQIKEVEVYFGPNLKKQVLFIHGAGEGAYEIDEKLVTSLRDALGAEYDVLYPRMPGEENGGSKAWIAQISNELAALGGKIILVGHSVGGSILLKYLSEENVKKPIVGIFLIATPYFGAEDWQVDEVTLHEGFGSQLPQGAPIFLYHSRDDEWVPFAHLAMYAKQLPQATIREFDGRGHQFNNDLSEVASDIANLQKEEI